MESKTVIEDINVHAASGHISLKVKSVTTHGNDSWEGQIRTYGVDAATFHGRFQGDVEQLKAWVRSQHLAYQGSHTDLVAALDKLKGQAL